MADPSEWAGDLSAESDSCLQDLHLFSQEMAKVYGDKARRCVCVAEITLIQEYIQLPQESVRAYANRLKANWRQAGWNQQKHEEVLYYIAWAGLCNSHKNKVEPMIPGCGRFNTLAKFFDKSAASEVTLVENKKLKQQQQQQQQQQKQPTDSSSKGSKRGYRHPSPSQPTPPVAANPANRDQTDMANQAAENNCQAYRQHHNGYQRKSSKADV